MSVMLDDDLGMIGDQARRFLDEFISDDRLKALLDTPGAFDDELWAAAVEQGWPAISAAEEEGGLGLGWRGVARLAEELGRRTASLPLIQGAVTAAALRESSNALLDPILADLAAGKKISAISFAEPGEAGLPQIPLVQLAEGRVTGRKASAPFAAVANVALVSASENGVPVLVLVNLEQPGVERVVEATIDQARASAALLFDGAVAVRLVEGDNAQAIADAGARAAVLIAFEQIGGAEAALAMAVDYAKQRKVFGQAIGRFQAIKHKLADMYWRIELARGCALDALDEMDVDPDWRAAACSARLSAIEAYDFTAQENVQTHAGIGVTWEGMPGHHYRRSRCLAVELGARAYWREKLLLHWGIGLEKAA